MQFKIKKGLTIPLTGEPEQRIYPGDEVSQVAIVGYDYIGVKRLPTMDVQVGDRVIMGQPLARGKVFKEVVGTAPGTGTVKAVHRGPQRVLETIVIQLEGSGEETFNAYAEQELSGLNRNQVQENLLASGLWLALRTRPYSMVARPDSVPEAIFVTAIDTNPLAPNPAVIVGEAREDFLNGLTVIAKLTEGKLFLCRGPDADIPVPNGDQCQVAEFAGPHPAGLVGTHIHFLHPVGLRRVVWHLGYQDVIAIGRLFTTGRINPERIVSLAGPLANKPRLIRTRLGASTNDLVRNEIPPADQVRVIAGSILNGRHAVGNSAFLGRYHRQITVLKEGREREFMGWINPGINKYSASRVLISNLFKNRRFSLTTSTNGSRRAMVPIGAYERVMPLDMLPTQLLRALIVGDTETSIALGCLELDEEDLALCSFVDPGKHDFGPILRRNLYQIWQEHQ
jgi:Na+-transporting NADH:ubiquinone oxidoreductase subunit A